MKLSNIYLYKMVDTFKKSIIILISILGLIIVCFFGVNYKIKTEIDYAINDLPGHIKFEYDEISINSFFGNLNMEMPMLTIYDKNTDVISGLFKTETIQIDDIGYWDILFNDNISMDKVFLNQLHVTYYHNKSVNNDAYKRSLNNSLKKSFKIGVLKIISGDIEVISHQTDSLLLKTSDLNLVVNQITVDDLSIKNKLPFGFNDFELTSNHFKYQLSDYEDLTLETLNITKNSLFFNDVKLKTKYAKEEFSRMILKERDYLDIGINSITFKDTDFNFVNDSIFQLKSKNVYFENPRVYMFRNKLIADDESYKSLYSKLLRELNFNIDLNEVIINQGEIIYEEKSNQDNDSGQLKFSDFGAIIKNLGNTYAESEQTKIVIESIFMENTPLKINWEFDVNNMNDHFNFKANMGVLAARHLNQFMQPNLNIKLEGELIKTYFTIDGNENTSKIDLKIDYDDFKVVVLKEDGHEKNKLLSSLINLFVSKTSQNKSDDFRYGSTSEVERDKTKSVFNFVWLNARSGLLAAMTGNGEKKN